MDQSLLCSIDSRAFDHFPDCDFMEQFYTVTPGEFVSLFQKYKYPINNLIPRDPSYPSRLLVPLIGFLDDVQASFREKKNLNDSGIEVEYDELSGKPLSLAIGPDTTWIGEPEVEEPEESEEEYVPEPIGTGRCNYCQQKRKLSQEKL